MSTALTSRSITAIKILSSLLTQNTKANGEPVRLFSSRGYARAVANGTKPISTPTIYLIGGCNGAGKTTFARDFLPSHIRLLNADEIARGLSPFNPSLVATRAGRLLLEEVHRALRARETFALESTLSG